MLLPTPRSRNSARLVQLLGRAALGRRRRSEGTPHQLPQLRRRQHTAGGILQATPWAVKCAHVAVGSRKWVCRMTARGSIHQLGGAARWHLLCRSCTSQQTRRSEATSPVKSPHLCRPGRQPLKGLQIEFVPWWRPLVLRPAHPRLCSHAAQISPVTACSSCNSDQMLCSALFLTELLARHPLSSRLLTGTQPQPKAHLG